MPSIDSLTSALTYSSTATLSTATKSLNGTDLLATPAADETPASGGQVLEVKEVKGSDIEESLRLFKKSWQLRGQIGDDVRDIARALKSSMKEIIRERPDLADTAFDFRLENGRIEVLDTRLEGADLQWLETQLNRNFLLVDKIEAFRADSVELVQTDALQNGLELNADTADLGRQLDDQVQFMQLFRAVSADIQDTLMPTGTYRTQTGEIFDLRGPMNTAARFLPFQRQMAAIEDGLNYITGDGRDTGIGLRMPNAYFGIGFELNKYLPDFDIESIGFHEQA